VEDVEDDALLLGELVELLADVVEDGVGGGDEVEVAAEVVGDGVDGVGVEAPGARHGGPVRRRMNRPPRKVTSSPRGRRGLLFFSRFGATLGGGGR